MTFPLLFFKIPDQGGLPAARYCLRIISLLAVIVLAALLQACSAVKIAYNQAPELGYWYMDGYFDFSEVQSLRVKEELGKLQAWHRQSQLPGYVDTLQKLQQQLRGDIDTAAACAIYEDAKRKLLAVSDRAEPTVVALAPTLQPAQFTHMEARFAKGNAEFRDDFLDGTPAKRRAKRLKQAISRAEMLYGSLDERQLAVLGQRIDQSRFDPQLAYAERVRRQQDALLTLRGLTAAQASPERVRSAMRSLFERSLNSPNPAYRDYFDKLTQDNCRTVAELHNSTTPVQRARAIETLSNYEQDLRALMAQKS